MISVETKCIVFIQIKGKLICRMLESDWLTDVLGGPLWMALKYFHQFEFSFLTVCLPSHLESRTQRTHVHVYAKHQHF